MPIIALIAAAQIAAIPAVASLPPPASTDSAAPPALGRTCERLANVSDVLMKRGVSVSIQGMRVVQVEVKLDPHGREAWTWDAMRELKVAEQILRADSDMILAAQLEVADIRADLCEP